MGAIERQVLQVKRKNSINCKLPEASTTADGLVASRSGPREVGMGAGVGDDSVGGGSVRTGSSITIACGLAVAGNCSCCDGSSATAEGFTTLGFSVWGDLPRDPQADTTHMNDNRIVEINFNFISFLSKFIIINQIDQSY